MTRLRSLLGVVAINVVTLLAMLGGLFISPPLLVSAYTAVTHLPSGSEPSKPSKPRVRADELPNYAQYSWARKHFEEFAGLETEYRDYLVWRRKDFSGETITIRDGLRETVVPRTLSRDGPEFHFFGGSTTWGSGVSDDTTYPSIFSAVAHLRAVNHGESGYIARQSISDLINYYAVAPEGPPRVIVFYDGVNDVSDRCRSDVSRLGTVREAQVRRAVARGDSVDADFSWGQTFRQLQRFTVRIVDHYTREESGFVDEAYSCHSSPEKAGDVAETLVNEWLLASRLARANGDEFVAILQPVAFFGSPTLDHIPDVDADFPGLREQYYAVYPRIVEAAQARPELRFLDYSDTYDSPEPLYFDYCHVSPQAHERLVARMIRSFGDLGVL